MRKQNLKDYRLPKNWTRGKNFFNEMIWQIFFKPIIKRATSFLNNLDFFSVKNNGIYFKLISNDSTVIQQSLNVLFIIIGYFMDMKIRE